MGRLLPMWMIFATTLNLSLRWLKGRWWLGTLFGAVGGPLAYYAGYKLGGVDFYQPMWLSLAALGVVWAVAMPSLMYLADRFDGVAAASPQTA